MRSGNIMLGIGHGEDWYYLRGMFASKSGINAARTLLPRRVRFKTLYYCTGDGSLYLARRSKPDRTGGIKPEINFVLCRQSQSALPARKLSLPRQRIQPAHPYCTRQDSNQKLGSTLSEGAKAEKSSELIATGRLFAPQCGCG